MTAGEVHRLVALVDGIRIQLLDESGRAFDDGDSLAGEWWFVDPAPGDWTLEEWEEHRIRAPLPGCVAIVDPERQDQLLGSVSMDEARRAAEFLKATNFDSAMELGRSQWVLVHDRERPMARPRRNGRHGETQLTDEGCALWVEADDDSAWVEVVQTFREIHVVGRQTVTLQGEMGTVVTPSGALRVSASVEPGHVDVIGRRWDLTLYLPPAIPVLQLVVRLLDGQPGGHDRA